MKPNLNLSQLSKANYARAVQIRDDAPLHFSDLSDRQICAIFNASDMAGEYLESLGRYNLRELSVEEWQTLMRVICLRYHDSMIPYTID